MIGAEAVALSGEDFVRRARARLTFDLPADWFTREALLNRGDEVTGDLPRGVTLKAPKAAAVLIPVVDHRPDATVLLTERCTTLRAHSGQIAFPGGRIDPGDASPLDAALREAKEEIGLAARHITPLGYLAPYLTGTGYLVVPTVALVTPPFRLTLNPDEVQDCFEVPLAFLMSPDNHQRGSRILDGTRHSFYVMPFAERNIWGITAGILRDLYERLYGPC